MLFRSVIGAKRRDANNARDDENDNARAERGEREATSPQDAKKSAHNAPIDL